MWISIGGWVRAIVVILTVAVLAGCAAGASYGRYEARMRDARLCDIETESYMREAKNANDLRFLALESCMALRGHAFQAR